MDHFRTEFEFTGGWHLKIPTLKMTHTVLEKIMWYLFNNRDIWKTANRMGIELPLNLLNCVVTAILFAYSPQGNNSRCSDNMEMTAVKTDKVGMVVELKIVCTHA